MLRDALANAHAPQHDSLRICHGEEHRSASRTVTKQPAFFRGSLNIQILHALCMGLDELLSRRHIGAHQCRKDRIGLFCIAKHHA